MNCHECGSECGCELQAAREYALDAVPDLRDALMPGENAAEVADALIETYPAPPHLDPELAREALIERLREAEDA